MIGTGDDVVDRRLECLDSIVCGDCVEKLRLLPCDSVDSIVTDPPYGLSFMGKKWDYDVPSVAIWRECLRVLKPGGHLLAFAGTRTQHRMAVRIEDAGFEIRDMIAWVYGSGFPKSLDISKAFDKIAGVEREDKFEGSFERRAGQTGNKKCDVCGKWLVSGSPCQCPRPQDKPQTEAAQQWDGWGTALKPAMEPITLARKPLIGTVAANVLEWGTGGLNINGCRVSAPDVITQSGEKQDLPRGACAEGYDRPNATMFRTGKPKERQGPANHQGRWPANFIHDGSQQVLDLFPQSEGGAFPKKSNVPAGKHYEGGWGVVDNKQRTEMGSGSAARFFYCAKASRSERDAGCEDLEHSTPGEITGGRQEGSAGLDSPRSGAGRTSGGRNVHPTVKPLTLMRYLVRLVTPPDGVCLDPFLGSGTTAVAAIQEGRRYIGIEKENTYVEIARQRISEARGLEIPR